MDGGNGDGDVEGKRRRYELGAEQGRKYGMEERGDCGSNKSSTSVLPVRYSTQPLILQASHRPDGVTHLVFTT